MPTLGSSGATSGPAEPASDVHPALRGYVPLWSILSLTVLGAFFLEPISKPATRA